MAGAIRAGAICYLHKDTNGTELRRAIKAAAAGQVQLSPAARRWLLEEMHGGPAADEPGTVPSLTERERDVLRLLAQGLSNPEISRELGLGENTVKTHVRNVLAKLGVHSRMQAVLQAQRLGLVPSAGMRDES